LNWRDFLPGAIASRKTEIALHEYIGLLAIKLGGTEPQDRVGAGLAMAVMVPAHVRINCTKPVAVFVSRLTPVGDWGRALSGGCCAYARKSAKPLRRRRIGTHFTI